VESCCTVSRGRDMIFSLPVLIYKVSSYLCICPEIWYEHHATWGHLIFVLSEFIPSITSTWRLCEHLR
jgi:hypothetical protein